MKKPSPLFTKVCGALLLLLTAVAWFNCWRLARNLPFSNADVLEVKILPKQKELVARSFVVQKGTSYQLTIDGQIPVSAGQSIDTPQNSIGFEIRSNDAVVVSRNSHDLHSGANIGETLSRFHANPGASYFLKLWFISSAVVSPTDPLIVRVSPDRVTQKNQAVAISILGPLSLFLTVASVFFIVRLADDLGGFNRFRKSSS